MATCLHRRAVVALLFTVLWGESLGMDDLDLDELLREIDEDGDGVVSMQEADVFFLRRIPRFGDDADNEHMQLRRFFDESLAPIFKKIDADGDGFLQKREVAKLMAELTAQVERLKAEM
eukprot:TRINITY_DN70246_c0_g1_i1.p4 TRINITY_DN70246_c0_g1~~TRINITY_DN70246_c0_g1_i1.p4  ORF type:complete len:119 (-),score=37.26 TRINITY_DN70246_c0_g1_i1:69-425(-)